MRELTSYELQAVSGGDFFSDLGNAFTAVTNVVASATVGALWGGGIGSTMGGRYGATAGGWGFSAISAGVALIFGGVLGAAVGAATGAVIGDAKVMIDKAVEFTSILFGPGSNIA
ncbi:putative membrane protein [Paraburkholderia xenovorans LB400]|uniref:Membrane protein n=1 Tax=Paraburkholderia xenovorans (strain LB400) TaxID=266265 RepID=Q13FX7_PARXL|nr:hypothetical protein [Paraburkholderia xenovorans]ABE37012.1 Putative membrane protein [Paraburkholderia xenovorans LB400]AIP35051.1 putative membrane protein [Paraburkholderia xenovorans LB400]